MKEIPLTQGKVALVDDDDFERVSMFKWCAFIGRNGKWYAKRGYRVNGKVRTILMHHIILGLPSNFLVDHQDNNGLNNQKINIRPATFSQNAANQKAHDTKKSSMYKGVSWHIGNNKWYARVSGVCAGYFANEVDAARAYDARAREVFGDFAQLNFPRLQQAQQTREGVVEGVARSAE